VGLGRWSWKKSIDDEGLKDVLAIACHDFERFEICQAHSGLWVTIKEWHNVWLTNKQRTSLVCIWHSIGDQHRDLTSFTTIHFSPTVEEMYDKRGATKQGSTDFHWLNNLHVSLLGRSPCRGFGGELHIKLGVGLVSIGMPSQSWHWTCSSMEGGVSSTSETFVNLNLSYIKLLWPAQFDAYLFSSLSGVSNCEFCSSSNFFLSSLIFLSCPRCLAMVVVFLFAHRFMGLMNTLPTPPVEGCWERRDPAIDEPEQCGSWVKRCEKIIT